MRHYIQEPNSPQSRVLELARSATVLRPRDLASIGVPREYLKRMCEDGLLDHPARGIYMLPTVRVTEHQSLIEACKRVPRGVVCLVSALRFHELTSQAPHEVWLAIGSKDWRPRIKYPRLRIARFSRPTLEYGVEARQIGGAIVRVFTPAKSVADCFKFRNKIGTDVAIEALRDCVRQRKATPDEIWRAAKVCRVANVMRPYLESVV